MSQAQDVSISSARRAPLCNLQTHTAHGMHSAIYRARHFVNSGSSFPIARTFLPSVFTSLGTSPRLGLHSSLLFLTLATLQPESQGCNQSQRRQPLPPLSGKVPFPPLNKGKSISYYRDLAGPQVLPQKNPPSEGLCAPSHLRTPSSLKLPLSSSQL